MTTLRRPVTGTNALLGAKAPLVARSKNREKCLFCIAAASRSDAGVRVEGEILEVQKLSQIVIFSNTEKHPFPNPFYRFWRRHKSFLNG